MKKVLYILGLLSDSDIDWMVQTGVRETVPKGKTLITEGEEVDGLYIILDGHHSVRASALGGKVITRLGSGEIVGELSFLDSRLPAATVTADEESTVVRFAKGDLNDKLEHDLGFAARFYRALGTFLADRLRTTVVQLGYSSGQPLQEEVEYQDELQLDMLERVSLAATRFDWMMRRLRGEA